MPGVFVTGAGTDVGKTYVTAALVRAMRAKSLVVDVLKPVVSGFDPLSPARSDPVELLEALGVAYSSESLARISPWRFAAPLSPPLAAQREGRRLEAQAVLDLCRSRVSAAGETLLLIEGAGGVMSPLDDERTMLDLIVEMRLPAILVAGSYLGSISHTLTALHVLRARTSACVAVVVSESANGPPLSETITALKRFIHDVPVFTLDRGGAAPTLLLGWLRSKGEGRLGAESEV